MFNLGLVLGVSSGIFWAINTLLLSKIMNTISASYLSTLFFVIPLAISFLHDFFSSFFLLINLKIKKTKISISIKVLLILILSSILGGPIGMGSYLIGAKLIGSSYSATISVLYPLIGLILDKLFFKINLNKNKVLGIILGIFSVILISFSKDDIIFENFYLGVLFSVICAFSWATEGVVASYAMTFEDISSDIAIWIRQLTSSMFYLFFIIPFIDIRIILKNLLDLNLIYLLIISSFIGSISYLLWYKSISIVGASIAMTLNISYILWIVLFEFLFLEKFFKINFIFSIILMLSGIFIITKGDK